MKCKIPEISWHNRDPVLSVDIQPKAEQSNIGGVEKYRLASGGTDAHVLIWYLNLNLETGDLNIDLAADLTRHQRAVNAVKWSPNGELLASGDDESVIFIWKLRADSETINIVDNTNEYDKETWLTMKILRGHMEDIYDLSWSPNSQFLVSGSVDNTAMMWDVHKGKSIAILRDHKGFVQGVAWDPRNQFIATMSTDRYLRIFDIQTRRVLHRINKSILPLPDNHELHEKNLRLFHDDTLQTFFRRLSFTPDGKLLITPAGVSDYDGVAHPLHTSYIFSRHALRQPAIILPSPDQYTVAIGCCPVLYRLRPHSENNPPAVPLPYRMIFAVATRCSVYFYDTQQQPPFAVISNIHYTRLTDITWSQNGRIVVVSSTDGFCSLITFDEGELGEEYGETAAMLLSKEVQVQYKTTNRKSHHKKKDNQTTINKKNNDLTPPKEQAEITTTMNVDREILDTTDKFETAVKKQLTAKPIEVRRQPRIFNQEVAKVEATQKDNDVIDVDQIFTNCIKDDEVKINVVESTINIDDGKVKTSDEIHTPKQNYQPPSERTPRRVALRTISTPKSKKKLIEEE